MTDSYISFTLKLEFGQNFCSNRSIRSSTYGKRNITDFPPWGSHFILIHLFTSFEENNKFINKNDQLPAWRKIGNIFFTICTWPNWPVGAKILSEFQIEGKTDVWISQVRRVKSRNRVKSRTWEIFITWKYKFIYCDLWRKSPDFS